MLAAARRPAPPARSETGRELPWQGAEGRKVTLWARRIDPAFCNNAKTISPSHGPQYRARPQGVRPAWSGRLRSENLCVGWLEFGIDHELPSVPEPTKSQSLMFVMM
jgi:hypothetical protein